MSNVSLRVSASIYKTQKWKDNIFEKYIHVSTFPIRKNVCLLYTHIKTSWSHYWCSCIVLSEIFSAARYQFALVSHFWFWKTKSSKKVSLTTNLELLSKKLYSESPPLCVYMWVCVRVCLVSLYLVNRRWQYLTII